MHAIKCPPFWGVKLLVMTCSILIGEGARVAVCLTGQLLRLELGSKLQNLILTNLHLDHEVHLYILLDTRVEKPRSAKPSHHYNIGDVVPYANVTSNQLRALINCHMPTKFLEGDNPAFQCRTRLERPKRDDFVLTGENPVCPVSGGCSSSERKSPQAKARFQNHMRWQASLRECVKWVMDIEFDRGFFYDFVMKLREDSYVMSPVVLNFDEWKYKIVSLELNNWRGLNDHDIIINRKYADNVFRGLAEDYYFQEGKRSSHQNVSLWWTNPEALLSRVVRFYDIKTKSESICNFSFAPISGRKSVRSLHHYMGEAHKLHRGAGLLKRWYHECLKVFNKTDKFYEYVPMIDIDFFVVTNRLAAALNLCDVNTTD